MDGDMFSRAIKALAIAAVALGVIIGAGIVGIGWAVSQL